MRLFVARVAMQEERRFAPRYAVAFFYKLAHQFLSLSPALAIWIPHERCRRPGTLCSRDARTLGGTRDDAISLSNQ
jgi:hypothetical protein